MTRKTLQLCAALMSALLVTYSFAEAPMNTSKPIDNTNRKTVEVPSFEIRFEGGPEYGSEAISNDGKGMLEVKLLDTISSDDFVGVGIFRLPTGQLNRTDLETVSSTLCTPNIVNKAPGPIDLDRMLTFSAACSLHGGKDIYGSLHRVDEKVKYKIGALTENFKKLAYQEGRKVLKLDATVDKIEARKDGFVVSVKFINGGDVPVSFSTPDQWSGNNSDAKIVAGSSGVGGWGFDLFGQSLTNADAFPDGLITVEPRSYKIVGVKTRPVDQAKRGTFEFVGHVFMGIRYDVDGQPHSKHVDFKLIPNRLTIDRDYPSTPEEWKDFDARKAKEVSSLLPGTTVTVPGYYRAISVFGPRAQFVTELKAGKPAPPLDINHWDKWEWETDLARTTICEAGDICPRDGRWVVRTVGQRLGDERVTHSQHERRLRTGDVMPTLAAETGIGRHYRWEWLGLS